VTARYRGVGFIPPDSSPFRGIAGQCSGCCPGARFATEAMVLSAATDDGVMKIANRCREPALMF
jgi:hypothetical protein